MGKNRHQIQPSTNVVTADALRRSQLATESMITAAGASGVLSFNTRSGAVTLTGGDVTTALGYTPASSAGVTSVTGTAPIVSSGGTTPAISISAATTSVAGSMSAADKTKLNAVPTLDAGTYTPTITLTTNIGAGTPQAFKYLRVDNIVTVSGILAVDVTASGDFAVRMSLPFASTISLAGQIAGSGVVENGKQIAAAISGFSGTAIMKGTTTTVTSQNWMVHFTYSIQ